MAFRVALEQEVDTTHLTLFVDSIDHVKYMLYGELMVGLCIFGTSLPSTT